MEHRIPEEKKIKYIMRYLLPILCFLVGFTVGVFVTLGLTG